jgi:hypothetical protein
MLEQMRVNPNALVDISPMKGRALPVGEISEDIERLDKVSEKILPIANNEIAHADRRGARFDDGQRPTLKELDDCVEAYAEIAKKYVLVLTGAAMVSIDPVEQFDADDIFRFAWIPSCSKCGHAADFHSDEHRTCNGGADDYHRSISAGTHAAFEPCECTATEADVYAQTASLV